MSFLLWMALCVVRSVSDICVRLYGLYRGSGGTRKLNPISVLFSLCLWVCIQRYLSWEICPSVACLVLLQACAWVACQTNQLCWSGLSCITVNCVWLCSTDTACNTQRQPWPCELCESYIRRAPVADAAPPGHHSNHMLDLCHCLMLHGFIKGDESGSQWPEREREGVWAIEEITRE